MKKQFLSLAFSSALLGLSIGSQAANMISTQELLQDCKGTNGTFITCEIYGQAVYDTYLVTRTSKTAPEFICLKQPAPTRKEVIQEFIGWAEKNTQYAADPAADSVLRFLAGKFPCGK